jgi:hypothetical protein
MDRRLSYHGSGGANDTQIKAREASLAENGPLNRSFVGLQFLHSVHGMTIYLTYQTNLIIFKDRNNLGNARIMGMQADLHLSNEQFFNCLMMFCAFSQSLMPTYNDTY